MMKMEEIRKMSAPELVKSTNELRDEINDMKRRLKLGEVQNPRVIRAKRRDLARMMTVLSEHLSKERA